LPLRGTELRRPHQGRPMIEFFVPGTPAAQGRPRTRVLHMGKRAVAQIYNPHNADDWKARVMIVARPYVPRVALTGPIQLVLVFRLPRPQTHLKRGVVRSDAPDWHTSKPDFDNFVKALLDALTAIKMWVDDCQVCDSRILKAYATEPGCFVRIIPIKHPTTVEPLCLTPST
jgi:Holliday junction resolvase RusA-like endonuclease